MTPGPCRVRRAFTLVESILAIAIVSLTLVAALTAVASVARIERARTDLQRSHLLGQELMTEVLSRAYADPTTGTANWGREAGESNSNRSTWDDTDDYDALSDSPPTYRDGTAIPAATGWKRNVQVRYANPLDLTNAGIATDTGIRRILVTVTSPAGKTTEHHALMTADGPLYDPEKTERILPNSLSVELQLTSEAARTLASSQPLTNEPRASANLLTNPGWEDNLSDWYDPQSLTAYFAANGILVAGGLYDDPGTRADLSSVRDAGVYAGTGYLVVSNRTHYESGPAQIVTGSITSDTSYTTEAYIDATVNDRFRIVLLLGDRSRDLVIATGWTQVRRNDGWGRVGGSLVVPVLDGDLRYAVWRIESKNDLDDFYVDEALLQ